jgi:hypothetical protein
MWLILVLFGSLVVAALNILAGMRVPLCWRAILQSWKTIQPALKSLRTKP